MASTGPGQAEDWDAALYLKFEDERTRPSSDLLARIPPIAPKYVVDLGCGPGNSTELLAHRFPQAQVAGIDTSPDMIAAARKRLPGATFLRGDVSALSLEIPADVLFANAVLQWVPDHEALMPRLMEQLAPGGVLAVQMPDNLEESSHVAMRVAAAEAPWADKLKSAADARTSLPSVDGYYAMLRPHCAALDIWRTTYHHPLNGHTAIAEWVKSTGLRPFLDPLTPEEREAYLARYTELVAPHYPVHADGKVLLAFPRLFLVARKPL
ncbi:trans-aconitate 2-methyltransferase [Aquabacter sp. L1I39]|uniref:trans-aconitate 2-methyltransferase n=1 Tax=Aquabacter sp. L1I39 TaxID=2820278 RepID=UPI001AD9A320|nr:trans-aconitate 2-methyltransferase [Aquabacter sp. L1I39]QTL04830.1 trans-aconitate 2-methyltransferase [Aquabacter sp. L1I39]